MTGEDIARELEELAAAAREGRIRDYSYDRKADLMDVSCCRPFREFVPTGIEHHCLKVTLVARPEGDTP